MSDTLKSMIGFGACFSIYLLFYGLNYICNKLHIIALNIEQINEKIKKSGNNEEGYFE